jgi:arsenite methyltransferase
MAPRSIAQQLSHPRGLLGRLVRLLMNRGNAKMNAFALQQLDMRPSDRVLEIGFGGGATLPVLIKGAAFVAGVDRSHDAVESAKARFSKQVMDGQAEFVEGTVEAIPFAAGTFDKVFTVNTVYFWRSLDAGFTEIHRVLSPGGRVVIGFLPKESMDRMNFPADIFTSRAPDDVLSSLAANGFSQARMTRPESTTPWNVVVATRGAGAMSAS